MSAHDPTLAPRGASEWFLAVYAADNPSTETVQAWLRWLDAAEENRQAFEEVTQVWQNTPSAVIARGMRRSNKGEYDGSVPVAEWRTRGRRWNGGRRAAGYSVAAAAALAALAVGLYWQGASNQIADGEFATGTGEHRVLQLADGSRVILGARSRMSVEFGSEERRIRLKSGEAYFAVRKDPRRPFTVMAFEGAITALGTAFNVRAAADRVTVTVTEGSVRVADAQPPAHGEVPLQVIERGQQLSYRAGDARPALDVAQVKHVDARESARWREGWLVYRDEPLKYVMADITRYTDIEIFVDGSAAGLQFSGAVSKNRIAEWIAALPEVAPVTVRREGGNFIIAAGVQ